jgi:cytochrome c oxidase subunit IV
MNENVAVAGHAHGAVGEHGDGHPGPALYALVAFFLVILTGLELTVYYVHALQPVLVPILLLLAVAKFVLVAGFYMHLHYDANIYVIFFGFPMILAIFIAIALILLFSALGTHLALPTPIAHLAH